MDDLSEKKFSLVRVSTFFLLAFILLAVWITKNWGVFCDDASYMASSKFLEFGDSLVVGKPFFYFWLNFNIRKYTGFLFGPHYGLFFLITFYVCLFSYSVCLFFSALELKKREWFFGALFFSTVPIFLFFQSQFQMETPAISFLLIYSALVLSKKKSKLKTLLIALVSIILVLLKPTTIPAFLLLGLWKAKKNFWRDTHLWISVLGAVLGLGINKTFLVVGEAKVFPFIGLGHLKSLYWPEKMFWRVLEVYSIYLAPFIFLFAWSLYKKAFKVFDFFILVMIFLSAHLIMTVSFFPDAFRYILPLLTVSGVLIAVRFFQKSTYWISLISIVLNMMIMQNIYDKNEERRFLLWPRYVKNYWYKSTSTIFRNIPIWSYYFLDRKIRKKVCYYRNNLSSTGVFYYDTFLRGISEHTHVHFDLEKDKDCDGTGFYVFQEYQHKDLLDPVYDMNSVCPSHEQSKRYKMQIETEVFKRSLREEMGNQPLKTEICIKRS